MWRILHQEILRYGVCYGDMEIFEFATFNVNYLILDTEALHEIVILTYFDLLSSNVLKIVNKLTKIDHRSCSRRIIKKVGREQKVHLLTF